MAVIKTLGKTLCALVSMIIVICGCTKNEALDTKLLTGEWVIKKGPITGFLIPGKYSQRIEFLENGNYSETVYTGSDASSNLSVPIVKKNALGNWSVSNNELVINSWEGDTIVGPYFIESISDSLLVLKFKNNEPLYFTPAALEFKDLKNEILGTWESITTRNFKGRLVFNSDGSGSMTTPDVSFGEMGVATGKTFKWWIENNRIMAKDYNAAAPSYTYGPVFINEEYIGVSLEVMKKKVL